MAETSVCDRFRQWAREAVEEWDGQSNVELLALIMDKFGVSRQTFFFDNREPTRNENHLLNLLSWRERENADLRQEVADLREQLDQIAGRFNIR